MTVAVGGEEAAAVLPEPGPDFFPVGLRELQTVQRGAREELKATLGMDRWQRLESGLHLEQEHEPMGLPLVAVFADEPGEVQIARGELLAGFLAGLAAGAGVRGFALVRMQFPAAGTPEATIRLLRAFEQEDFVAFVKTVEQRGDLVGQFHAASEAQRQPRSPAAGWRRWENLLLEDIFWSGDRVHVSLETGLPARNRGGGDRLTFMSTFKRRLLALVGILISSGAPAFTTNDAATSFTAFNAAFMSNGAYPGWWTGAELVEMAEDAYDNSPSVSRRNLVTSACNGFLSQNGSTWTGNEYNDDISWAVIAFARGYLITGNPMYRDIARANWDAMFARGWDTNYFGGGLWWRQSDRQSKNACIQGPATIGALYLHRIYGGTNYLAKAQAIHNWSRQWLFNSANGSVYDNINTNGTVDTVALTYNQGTFIGAANLLHHATGLPGYYQDANLAARRTQNSMTTAGILPEWESNSDLSGFNGIFARWMARFAKEQNLWSAFGPWLTTNANAAWSIRNASNLAWQKWRTPTPTSGSELGAWGCSASVVVLQVADPSPADALQVTPGVGFVAVAEPRHLPAASSTSLLLTNTGTGAVNWSLGGAATWLDASAAGGSLPAGDTTTVTVSLVPTATTNLPAGRYFAEVGITNLTTGVVAIRRFALVLSAGSAPLALTGYNASVLAPNDATVAAPNATAFDLPNNYSFYQVGLNNSTRGLPPEGTFTSQWDRTTVFQIGTYGRTNTLVLGNTYPGSATLTLLTPRAYRSLVILACSANGDGLGTCVLNFTDGTHSPAYPFNAQDWFGTTANVAIQGFGRLKLGGGFSAEDNGASNPNLYQTTLNLAALGWDNKEIASLTFTKPAGAGATQTVGIFAVSGTLAYREPVITQQPAPANRFRFVGASNSWSVTVNAAPPVAYRWRLNGNPIADATNATYQLPNLQTNHSGDYTVVISNTFGAVTSSVAALTVMAAPAYPLGEAILADRPLAYWRLDETSGAVARDYVADHNGTYSAALLGQPGNHLIDPHPSVRFGILAANNSCVTNLALDFSTPGNAAFSVEAWVNGGAQTSDAGLVTKGYGSGGEQFNLDCGGPGRAFRFFVRDGNGNARLATSSITPNNQWHHLVGVCDQVNGVVRLYVDGVQAAQGSLPPNSGILGSTASVSIGSRPATVGAAYNNQFVGSMEEVAIYGHALNASRVMAHFQAATNRAPVFSGNPLPLVSAPAGQIYSATLAGAAADPNGDPIVFSKISGPAWLNVAGNGGLSGTPFSVDVGTNNFQVSATDSGGLAGSTTLQIAVIAAPPILLGFGRQGDALLLNWTGGIPPYQVQWTTNPAVFAWENLGAPVGTTSVAIFPTNAAALYRVYGR